MATEAMAEEAQADAIPVQRSKVPQLCQTMCCVFCENVCLLV